MCKYVLSLLSVLLAVSFCLPALADPYMAAVVLEPDSGDIALDDALAIAKDAYRETIGEAYDEAYDMNKVVCFLTVELHGDTQRAWHLSLQSGGGEAAETVAVTVLSPSGEVVEVERYSRSDRHAEWEAEIGPYPLWTLEEKALFYEIYDKMEDNQYGNGVPQAHDLTDDEAVEIAMAALVAEKGADPNEMASLMLCTAFYTKLHDDPGDGDFWAVAFLREDADAPGGYQEVYCANIASPDGEVYLLYSLYEDGRLNG